MFAHIFRRLCVKISMVFAWAAALFLCALSFLLLDESLRSSNEFLPIFWNHKITKLLSKCDRNVSKEVLCVQPSGSSEMDLDMEDEMIKTEQLMTSISILFMNKVSTYITKPLTFSSPDTSSPLSIPLDLSFFPPCSFLRLHTPVTASWCSGNLS